jgi:hypothetical protein
LSRSPAWLVVSHALKFVFVTLSRLSVSVFAVTIAGRPVPTPAHAVGLGGLACSALAMVGHSRSLFHAAPRWLALPLSSSCAHAGVNLALCPCRGQPTGLPVHIPPCLCVHPGVPHPGAHVVQLPFGGPSCRFGGDAAIDLSFPPLQPWSLATLIGCSLVEPPRPNVLCTLLRWPVSQSPVPTLSRVACRRAPILGLARHRAF